MDLSKAFKTNKEKEQNGAWVDIGDGSLVCVARVGNPEYTKLLDKLMKPHRRTIRSGSMPEGLMDMILIKTIAHTILLGWEGMQYKGEDLEYSLDNATMVLTELPDFRAMIAEIGNEMETFKDEEEEEGIKNSSRSSDGDSTGETTILS